MKKLLSIILASLFCFPPAASCAFEGENISISINDYILPLPHEAFLINGAAMASVYDICTPLQLEYKISGDKIHISREAIGVDMTFTLESDTALISDETIKLNHKPFITGDQHYIPLDALCEACEYDVAFENGMYKIYTTTPEILKWLKRFDEFAGKDALDFVLHQYDPEEGGFYFSPSTRDYEGFGTDIESTNQALGFLSSGKPQGWYSPYVGDVLPQKFKDKITQYAQSRQDPDDGYFYNEWQGHNVGTQKRERDLTYGNSLASWWGDGPLYELPSERLAQAQASGSTDSLSSAYDFVKSKEAFIKWMNSFNWENAYGSGSTMAASVHTIRSAGLEMTAVEFLESMQNPETGLWGEGYTYDATNAAMKIGVFFNTGTKPYPKLSLMVDSVIKTLKGTDEPETICEVWNPLYALLEAIQSYGPQMDDELRAYLDQQLPELMEITYKNLIQFKRKDGGTSYFKTGSRSVHHGSVIGLGLEESDMDAIYIGTLQIRSYFYSLARHSFKPPIYEPYKDYITEYFENPDPIVKKTLVMREVEDMENSTGGNLPEGFTSTAAVGSVTLSSDPENSSNSVIKLDTVPGGLTALSYAVSTPPETERIIFECDLYVEKLSRESTFYNPIGTSGLQWCIKSTDGLTFNLSTRENEIGTGQNFKTGLPMGKWHHIKIIYEPGTRETTFTKYFVNNKLCKRSGLYYYGNNVNAEPEKNISGISFKSFSSADGTLYLDNISYKTEPK